MFGKFDFVELLLSDIWPRLPLMFCSFSVLSVYLLKFQLQWLRIFLTFLFVLLICLEFFWPWSSYIFLLFLLGTIVLNTPFDFCWYRSLHLFRDNLYFFQSFPNHRQSLSWSMSNFFTTSLLWWLKVSGKKLCIQVKILIFIQQSALGC